MGLIHGTPDVLTLTISHLVSFGIAFAAWRYVYVPSCIDQFREHMFRLRRELFMYMADGHIAPTHPAYCELREMLNGLLRHSERFTFWWTLTVMIVFGRTKSPVDDALEAMPHDEVHSKLVSIRSRAARSLFRHIRRRTPLLSVFRWCVYLPVRKVIDLTRLTHRLLQRFSIAVTAEARLLDDGCEA